MADTTQDLAQEAREQAEPTQGEPEASREGEAYARRSVIAMNRLISLMARAYGEEGFPGAPEFVRRAMSYAADLHLGLREWSPDVPNPAEDEILAALRSEAGGGVPAHVYVVTANDDERVAEQKVFASRQDAQREYERLVDLYGGSAVCLASRYVRAALRSEAQGEDELAALVVHMWLSKEQRGPLYTESGDFYVDFRRAYELAAARTNGGSDV